MTKAKMIYLLMNDLLRYLLKYGAVNKFTEADVEQALSDSEQICQKYEKLPCGIGFLARKMCMAINSYLNQLDQRRNGT